jgi:hypothetical protein
MPIDSENHLMDAMRYAFEDVKYFRESGKDANFYSGRDLLLGRWNQ